MHCWGRGGGGVGVSRQPRRPVEADGNREHITERTKMAWRQRQEKKEHGSRTRRWRQLQNCIEGPGKTGNRRKLTAGGSGGGGG